ncbi:unnamed protein product [Brachionus calyciflorus]|uniref:Cdc23 domain-containing protein n=1 Tax=Brachionus calyciflorus TaxID=104777 RepID=A0A813NUN7_9BILA|nr:unnamed protein product [Brachionus calyciflorus]
MSSLKIILNKTNTSDIAKELQSCIITYDYYGLSRTQKWCCEMLSSIEDYIPNEDALKLDFNEIVGSKEFVKFKLAMSYFDLKEYQRAAYYLEDCESQPSYFLHIYSKYMAIMKKNADNKADLFNNIDPDYLNSLQSLRSTLSSKYYKKQLDAFGLYVYAIVLNKLKLYDEAINILIESIKKRPSLWCSWIELASLVKSIETLNSLNHNALPQHWMKDLFLANCYMELSLSEEALNIYSVYCQKGFAKSIYIKSQMAKCYDNLREGRECKQTFEFIRKLDPYNLDFMDIYSNVLFVLEEHVQLAILAQEACEIDKYKPESCCIIGNYYSLQNEHHKAVSYFQRALKLNSNYLQAWTLMGHEFMELKNSTSAIQSYTNAIDLNPKDYRAWYGLGQTYEILKLYSYSLYYYKQAYLLRPNDSRFIVALGDVYAKLEKWDEAKRCYIKAYTVGDYEGSSLCKLAKVYEKLNEPINVAIAYDQFTEDQKILKTNSTLLNQELSQAYKYLANFYLKKMKLDQAYEAATKCLDFPETRQEAQSILSQIAQARNSIKEQESATGSGSSNVDMEIGSSNTQSDNGLLNVNRINQRGLSPSLIVLDNSDNPNINDTNISINTMNINQNTESSQGTSVEAQVNSNSTHIQQDSDSESEHFFSNFNIKKRTLN